MAAPPQTRNFLLLPSYDASLQDKVGNTHQSWYRFFDGVANGVPPDKVNNVPVTPSPMQYAMPYGGYVVANGGTITAVTLTRDKVTPPVNLPLTGTYHASKADILTITYSDPPTLQLIPQ